MVVSRIGRFSERLRRVAPVPGWSVELASVAGLAAFSAAAVWNRIARIGRRRLVRSR